MLLFKRKDASLKAIVTIAGLLLATVLYVVGVRVFFVPILIGVLTLYLPVIGPFRSLAGRFLLAVVVYYGASQLLFLVQFLVWPTSGFNVAVVVLCVLAAGLVMWRKGVHDPITSWFGRADVRALIASLFLIIAFLPIVVGNNTVYRIGQIGAGQAIDGINHFAMISESLQAQNYYYKVGAYYPRGFHQATALVESTAVTHQSDMGWRSTVILYFLQYIVFAVFLMHCVSYLIESLYTALLKKETTFSGQKWYVAIESAVYGGAMALFIVLPFVQHGFLSYYYICGSIIAAIAVLVASRPEHQFAGYIIAALLLFGAGSSWPLLAPLSIAVLLFYALFMYGGKRLRALTIPRQGLLLLLLIVQLVPIAVQIHYSGDAGGDQGLNLTGDLRIFHIGTLILSVGIIAWVAVSKYLTDDGRNRLLMSLVPIAVFVMGLVCYQYFTTGEVRYYAIKVQFVLELIMIAFVCAGVTVLVRTRRMTRIAPLLVTAALPLAILVPAYAVSGNPFYDLRNLFRTLAHQEKPQFFDADVSMYSHLASTKEIDHFNSTLVHYDPAKHLFYAHMQLPYWMNTMQYDGTKHAQMSLNCSGNLYSILNFQSPSDEQQQAFKEKLVSCNEMAKENGVPYYIVTDTASAPYVHAVFPDKNIEIVTES